MTIDQLNKGIAHLLKTAKEISFDNDRDVHTYNGLAADYNQDSKLMASGINLGALALSLGLSGIAASGMHAKDDKDKINLSETKAWAKKYLNTDDKHIDIAPEPGLGNAYYQEMYNTKTKRKGHQIRYDPEFNKSIAAHEIGHGMGSFPRIPFANLIAPWLLMNGGYHYGTNLAMGNGEQEGLGKLLLGGVMLAPTLIDEYGASSRAKKILKDNNIKPRGLTRAWATYAAPLGIGAGALGAGYALAKHYTDKLHETLPNVNFYHK